MACAGRYEVSEVAVDTDARGGSARMTSAMMLELLGQYAVRRDMPIGRPSFHLSRPPVLPPLALPPSSLLPPPPSGVTRQNSLCRIDIQTLRHLKPPPHAILSRRNPHPPRGQIPNRHSSSKTSIIPRPKVRNTGKIPDSNSHVIRNHA